jgi:hypothetical protein
LNPADGFFLHRERLHKGEAIEWRGIRFQRVGLPILAGGVTLPEFVMPERNGFPSQFASRKPRTIPAIRTKNVRLMNSSRAMHGHIYYLANQHANVRVLAHS